MIQIANAYAALETAITTDGVVTDNGNGTSSITVNYNTETNIDSSFTVTGGLNNMVSIVNVDGAEGELAPATTITVIDPEATEVASFTSSAALAGTNNVDEIAAQIVTAVNANIETPINFDADYDSATQQLVLTARRAGNTNPWTIVFDNNGVTGVNAGNLGYTSSQSGELINELATSLIESLGDSSTFIRFNEQDSRIDIVANGIAIMNTNTQPSGTFMSMGSGTVSTQILSDAVAIRLQDGSNNRIDATGFSNIFNSNGADISFLIKKNGTGNSYFYNSTADTTTIDSDTINFVANTITGLPDTTVTKAAVDTAIGSGTLDTDYYASDKTWRTLPTGATPTTVLGTADEIDVANSYFYSNSIVEFYNNGCYNCKYK